MSRWLRPALQGMAAGGCAALAMVLVAGAGIWLLDVPVSGGLVAAVVVMAVGGDAGLTLGPFAQGTLDAMPLGVTLAGALALAAVCWLPPRRNHRPAVRAGAALLTSVALAWPAARAGRGTIELSGRGTVGFHTDPWSTLAGAAAGTIVVLALCWLAVRFEPVRRTVRAVGVVLGAASGLCLVAGTVAGLAGGALLAAPNVVGLAVPYGLGVPVTVDLPGVPDPGGRLRIVAVVVSVIVVLAIGLLVARPIHAGIGVGLTLLAGTLLAGVSGRAGLGGFDAMTLEVRGNPWLAFLIGLAAGAVAGAIGAALDKNGHHGKPARSR